MLSAFGSRSASVPRRTNGRLRSQAACARDCEAGRRDERNKTGLTNNAVGQLLQMLSWMCCSVSLEEWLLWEVDFAMSVGW